MPEFLELLPPDQALQRLLDHLRPQRMAEEIPLAEALGRVAASPIVAEEPLPAFTRSSVDGYALRAEETYGASDGLPAYLHLQGEILMGVEPGFELLPGSCALVHTGGMLPGGANAVVMLEFTQLSRIDEIEILKSTAIGDNVIYAGEDVSAGDKVIPQGKRLRPAEIGGLAALGKTRVSVILKPRIAIISTGDELVSPEKQPASGQVRDINSFSLGALIADAGGVPVDYGIVVDREDELLHTAERALIDCDGIVISAGSSASSRDITSQVIHSLGEPGILVHGINLRPGKPTILAVCNYKPVIGLPGNPVSALVVAQIILTPMIKHMLGCESGRPLASVSARLTINLPSQAGREDWVAVRLEIDHESSSVDYRAIPVFGKSNLIFTLVRADGMFRIPPEVTGLSAGETVHVFLS
jgi:molybdopterin molybdotransferase